jgi:hypothetical protein
MRDEVVENQPIYSITKQKSKGQEDDGPFSTKRTLKGLSTQQKVSTN